MRAKWIIAWALTLGFALTALAGPASARYAVDDGSGTQSVANEDVPAPQDGREYVTIGLAVRWGYLDDPAVAWLEGKWRWNDTRTGGGFVGRWQVVGSRLSGFLWGGFALPDDGRGRFRGEWNFSTGDEGGFLMGAWVRADRGHGFFEGSWNFSTGRDGGALAGRWGAIDEAGGVFRGEGIAAPSLRPVSWDGFLHVSDGAAGPRRTVRWERGEDMVWQRDRQTVAWRSTTTVNWDGLVFVLHVPKARPPPVVVLHTEQADFRWSAAELVGLHVRKPVDRLGHEIEVRGFLVERDFAKVGIGIRWGLLDGRGWDEPSRNYTAWVGGAKISAGGLHLTRVLSFERSDRILPEDDRQLVAWRSTTTTGWDGVVLVAFVPFDDVFNVLFSIRAGAFRHTFALPDLLGHHVFDVDGVHELEVRAARL